MNDKSLPLKLKYFGQEKFDTKLNHYNHDCLKAKGENNLTDL